MDDDDDDDDDNDDDDDEGLHAIREPRCSIYTLGSLHIYTDSWELMKIPSTSIITVAVPMHTCINVQQHGLGLFVRTVPTGLIEQKLIELISGLAMSRWNSFPLKSCE